MKKKYGWIYALLGGAFWGLSGTCGQFVFSHSSLGALNTTWIRLLLSGLALTIYSILFHFNDCKKMLKNPKDIVHLLVFAIGGLLFCQLSYLETIQYSNSGTATVLQYSGIILIMLVTCLIEKHLPQKKDLIALVFVLLGIFFVATHGNISGFVISQKALIWGAIAAITLLTYTMLPGKLLNEYGPANILGWSMLIDGICFTFYIKPWQQSLSFSYPVLLAFFVIIVFGTIFSFTLYLTAVNTIGAMQASMLACIEPVVATISSALFLHTIFTGKDIIGFLFIMFGVLFVSYQKKTA